jgi:hypothetical protein
VRQPAVVLVTALLGCQPAVPRVDKPPVVAATDTVRGTFVLEGSEPYTIPVLRTAHGRIVVDGATSELLKLSQLDLWMKGTRTSPTGFRVSDFRVRAANGVKAWNGVLRTTPNGFRLELEDGTSREIKGAPSRFTQLTGSRMWITETPDGRVLSYGII